MACLNPIHIYNRVKELQYQGTPFALEVPCGQCAECKKQMQDEYNFRAYYQALDCIEHGGYVYFDTLTYRPKDVPHISDFLPEMKEHPLLDHMCFNVQHYRHFIVRLRKNLTKKGYAVANNLKYFLVSEYGTDETKTHRPHYHILFYCNVPNLDNITLSKAISDAWPYGRTDGIAYKGLLYVNQHTYRKDGDTNYMQNIVRYVAKYVTKNSSFDKTIDVRINRVLDLFVDTDKAAEVRKVLNRQLREFHRQSQGFGLYALRVNDPDVMFRTGMMQMTDGKKVINHIPMPMYFQRKLFYDLTTDSRGNKQWKLNPKGIDYKVSRMDEIVKRMADRMQQWYDNLDNLIINGISDHNTTDAFGKYFIDRVKSFVNTCLDGRSWTDYCTYVLVFKGRLKSREQFEREINENKYYIDETPKEFYKKSMQECPTLDSPLFNYVTPKDEKAFGEKFISNEELSGDTRQALREHSGDIYTHREIEAQLAINEGSDPRFMHFDKLYSCYVKTLYYEHTKKTNTFNVREDFKRLFDKFKC